MRWLIETSRLYEDDPEAFKAFAHYVASEEGREQGMIEAVAENIEEIFHIDRSKAKRWQVVHGLRIALDSGMLPRLKREREAIPRWQLLGRWSLLNKWVDMVRWSCNSLEDINDTKGAGRGK